MSPNNMKILKRKGNRMKKKTVAIIILLVIAIIIASNFFDSNLDGKKIAFVGDSIMAGYGNNEKSFEYYFKQALPNSELVNLAKGGATISDNSPSELVIKNQVQEITGSPDIILFEGGANDIIDYAIGFLDKSLEKPIGTVDLESSNASNENTVMADFEELIITLKEKFPEAKLCYLQIFLIDDTTIDNITLDESKKPEIRQRRDELYTQVKLACQKWNVSYIDVSDKFIDTGTQYRQADWIHINEIGYERLTPYILEKLKEI